MAFARKKTMKPKAADMDSISEDPEDELGSARHNHDRHATKSTERNEIDKNGVAGLLGGSGVPKLNLKMSKAPVYQPKGDSDISKSRSKSGSAIRNQFLSKAIL